jgi:hypothetical protein
MRPGPDNDLRDSAALREAFEHAGLPQLDPQTLRPTALSVRIPGLLRNPLNGSHGHWAVAYRERSRRRRQAVDYLRVTFLPWRGAWPRTEPKQITFEAHVARPFDTDNLQACLKPYRDAVVMAEIVEGDGPAEPHEWIYAPQVVGQCWRGVVITIRPSP